MFQILGQNKENTKLFAIFTFIIIILLLVTVVYKNDEDIVNKSKDFSFEDKKENDDIVFNNILIDENSANLLKGSQVDYITETPFQKTLYLDSDTVIVRDISDMFDVLDRFDVAVTNDYARKRKKYSSVIPEYEAIPYSFSEVNGGIMAYNSSKASVEFPVFITNQNLLQRSFESNLFYLLIPSYYNQLIT